MAKSKKRIISFVDIEICASSYDGTLEEFSSMLWINFFIAKNKQIVNGLARELNIYPTPSNVHYFIMEKLTEGVAI